MKIVIGVDTEGHYRATLSMAARLKFPDPHWTLVYSGDMSVPVTGYGIGESAYGMETAQLLSDAGEKLLEEARDDACAHGFVANSVMLAGPAGGALVQYAEDTDVDLVAVHSQRKGRFGSFFLGSVSRGLAIGAKHSGLITKGMVSPNGSLTAVFATDHSDYAKKALDKFIEMHPAGITAIKVVTASHLDEGSDIHHLSIRHGDPSIVESLRQQASRLTQEVVQKLQAAGYPCSGEVVDAQAVDAISQAIKSTRADLLVMGAQGHGFMHRLMIGSTSLHQVVAEPYSVLILRP